MANEMTPKFGFHHIALMCADIEKSLSMYKALGMQEVLRWGEGKNLIVMVDVGDGGRIELFANGGDDYSPMTEICGSSRTPSRRSAFSHISKFFPFPICLCHLCFILSSIFLVMKGV